MQNAKSLAERVPCPRPGWTLRAFMGKKVSETKAKAGRSGVPAAVRGSSAQADSRAAAGSNHFSRLSEQTLAGPRRGIFLPLAASKARLSETISSNQEFT